MNSHINLPGLEEFQPQNWRCRILKLNDEHLIFMIFSLHGQQHQWYLGRTHNIKILWLIFLLGWQLCLFFVWSLIFNLVLNWLVKSRKILNWLVFLGWIFHNFWLFHLFMFFRIIFLMCRFFHSWWHLDRGLLRLNRQVITNSFNDENYHGSLWNSFDLRFPKYDCIVF